VGPGRFLDDGRGHENGGYALGGTMAVRFGYCMYVWLCFTIAGGVRGWRCVFVGFFVGEVWGWGWRCGCVWGRRCMYSIELCCPFRGGKRTASRFHVGDRLSSVFVEKDIYIHTRASSSRINMARKIRISYYKHNPAIKPHRSHRLAPHCPSPPASPLPYSSASLSLTTLSAH